MSERFLRQIDLILILGRLNHLVHYIPCVEHVRQGMTQLWPLEVNYRVPHDRTDLVVQNVFEGT